MKVRMKVHISGLRNGAEWPEAGGFVDVPSDEAASLAAAGLAELVAEEPRAKPETAVPRKRAEKRG